MRSPSYLAHFFACTLIATAAICLQPALAQSAGSCAGWSASHTPAVAVPKQLWGSLRPMDTARLPQNRDNTAFREIGSWVDNPYFQAIDIEADTIFVANNLRLQLWNSKTAPGRPALLSSLSIDSMGLTWGVESHAFLVFQDVDAPPGRDDLVALAGWHGTGLMVFDTTDRSLPRLLYQDHGADTSLTRQGNQVYTAAIDGRAYAFLAATQADGGLFAYDLDAAKPLPQPCIEGQPGLVASDCPGVFLGRIGSRSAANFVDGVDHFVAVTSLGNPSGLEIWDVRDPSQPRQVTDALQGRVLYGVAMWKQSGAYYLAVREAGQHSIYDASCIANGPCTPALVWSRPATSPAQPGLGTVTFSRADGTPFLYWGTGSVCPSFPQEEWLDDVSNAWAPRDITPQEVEVLGGEEVSYWSWYYRSGGVNGFNNVQPQAGKFNGTYFYRVAKGLFDVHQRTEVLPPLADFTWSPEDVYSGLEVAFADASTGLPSSYSWSFEPDGDPATSDAEDPAVTFFSTGTKTVTLQVTNGVGSGTTSRQIIVREGPPQVTGLSVTPMTAMLCQPITFQAEGVTGEPPLTYAWQVYSQQGHLVAVGDDSSTFVWEPAPPEARGGQIYTAEVTVSNNQGAATLTSPLVPIQWLPDLPGDQAFVPTYEGYPAQPTSRTVQFDLDAPGAVEWRWNFDLGGGQDFEPWSSDPNEGKAPRFTYAEPGTYIVVAEVRNCAEGTRTSAPLVVTVPGPDQPNPPPPPPATPERESRVPRANSAV